METFEKNDKRTHYCATLTKENIGQRVCVLGWAQKQRDLGSLIFIDLRDRSGIVQLAFDEKTDREIFDKAFGVRAEFVLCAKGVVRERATVNKNIPTGDIEVYVDEFKSTLAEVSLEQKNTISHRAKALRALKELINEDFSIKR